VAGTRSAPPCNVYNVIYYYTRLIGLLYVHYVEHTELLLLPRSANDRNRTLEFTKLDPLGLHPLDGNAQN